jgi:hypothetical protein
MELLLGDPKRAIDRWQERAFRLLHAPAAKVLVDKCMKLGAPYPVLETSLCRTYARLELIPQRIKLMLEARPENKRALENMIRTGEALRLADGVADQTAVVFGIVDPTKPPAEVWSAQDVLIDHFASAPAAEWLLRARLGLSSQRLHDHNRIARHAAFGYFAFLLHQRFRDGAPHDALVADLVWATISIRVEATDVQHHRDAYAKRQANMNGPPIREEK